LSTVLPVVGERLPKGLPLQVTSHMSGGRDRWSQPLAEEPADATAAARDALREVLDPEIPISLIDLGLIYGVQWNRGEVTVRLTYTATACPCMEFIREDITDRLRQESWVRSVRIEEVWDPPWTADRISPEGRTLLRGLGVGT